MERLSEKGYLISKSAFLRWMRSEKELYAYYREKNKEMRKIRNADCGKYKQHYKF
jgi:hypothetical protein